MRKLPAQRAHYIHPSAALGLQPWSNKGTAGTGGGSSPLPTHLPLNFLKSSIALIGPWSRRSLLWTWPYSGKAKPERCKITTLTMTLCDYGFKVAPPALHSAFSPRGQSCVSNTV